MHRTTRSHRSIFGGWNSTNAMLAIMPTLLFAISAFLLITLTAQPAIGQTYQVLYSFTGEADGGYPLAGLTIDRGGNFYGTTYGGGTVYGGTVFSFKQENSGWVETPIYSFLSGNDGLGPAAPVVFGPDGSLYGTAEYGGGGGCGYPPLLGCGTIYNLKPPPTPCLSGSCSWTETQLYRFAGGQDGAFPAVTPVVFDSAGHLYGTTPTGGDYSYGQVYELTNSNGHWLKSSYSFTLADNEPTGVVFDNLGNLYGTSTFGGSHSDGTVFRLRRAGVGWLEDHLYSFQGGDDGQLPFAGVIVDSRGNVYGGTTCGSGTIFMLSPSGGNWTFTLLHDFASQYCNGPRSNLTMDSAGNLYGTAFGAGVYGNGSVFKLTPSPGGWTYTSLHDFTGGSDGALPVATPVFDSAGNLYGTTSIGGAYNDGTIFRITP